MVRDGIPYVLVPLALGMVLWFVGIWPAALVFGTIAVFMRFFFRDPKRNVPAGRGLIVSAADGRVTRIDERPDGKLVSVFLSPFDVHINRSPIAGRVVSIEYTRGRRIPATSDEASLVNERNTLLIEGDEVTIACTQIAGILARRIVCWPKTGDNLERGQRIGLIKFGSRTDLLLPRNSVVMVQVGDRVRGGETVIAGLPGAAYAGRERTNEQFGSVVPEPNFNG